MSTTSSKLRYAVAAIAALETVIVVFLFWIVLSGGGLMSSEELSRKISKALLVVYGVPYLVLVLPAVILTVLNRWLPLALLLCTVGVGLALIFAKSWA